MPFWESGPTSGLPFPSYSTKGFRKEDRVEGDVGCLGLPGESWRRIDRQTLDTPPLWEVDRKDRDDCLL